MKSSKQRDVDMFVVVFSVSDLESFQAAVEKWIPNVKFHFPNVPFVLVGNNHPLRFEKNNKKLSQTGKQPITAEMSEELANSVNAASYLECCSSDGDGIEKVFEETVWASLRHAERRRKKSSNAQKIRQKFSSSLIFLLRSDFQIIFEKNCLRILRDLFFKFTLFSIQFEVCLNIATPQKKYMIKI